MQSSFSPCSDSSVGLVTDDVEVAVELGVDLAPVGTGDLDLVVALLVADLGVGHLPATRSLLLLR
jgi:hypothetical protein